MAGNTLMSILVKLGVEVGEFKKGLGDAEKEADKSSKNITKSLESASKTMRNVGVGMTAALTVPIAAFATSSVQSAMDAESAVADLEAVLKSTGGAAGMTLDELLANASALQKVTKFSDEAVMSAQGMLLTFTNIGKDIFPDATMATLNMAEKFGMDASQAAITLGKALNDPVGGVTALRRIGVMLTDEQEKQIKSFVEVGDVASAQAIIMKELAVEIGGVAEAAGATSSGKMEQFKNKLDDMKEVIGSALIPVLIRFMDAITPLIEKFTNAPPAMQTTIIAIGGIVAAIGPLLTILSPVVSMIGTLAGLFGAGGALAGAGAAISAAILPVIVIIGALAAAVALLYVGWKNNWFGIQDTLRVVTEGLKGTWQAFLQALQGDWQGAGETLKASWSSTWDLIQQRFEPIKEFFSGIGEFFSGAFSGIENAFSGLIQIFTSLYNYFSMVIKEGDTLNDHLSELPESVKGAVKGFGDFVAAIKNVITYLFLVSENGLKFDKWILEDIPASIRGGVEAIGNFIQNIKKIGTTITSINWKSLGKSIIDGVINGIKNGASSLISAAKKAAQDAFDAVKNLLGISSPSKLFAGIGQNMMSGMAMGINNGISMPVSSLATATPQLVGAVAGGGREITYNQYNTVRNDLDIERIAYRTAEIIKKHKRR